MTSARYMIQKLSRRQPFTDITQERVLQLHHNDFCPVHGKNKMTEVTQQKQVQARTQTGSTNGKRSAGLVNQNMNKTSSSGIDDGAKHEDVNQMGTSKTIYQNKQQQHGWGSLSHLRVPRPQISNINSEK